MPTAHVVLADVPPTRQALAEREGFADRSAAGRVVPAHEHIWVQLVSPTAGATREQRSSRRQRAAPSRQGRSLLHRDSLLARRLQPVLRTRTEALLCVGRSSRPPSFGARRSVSPTGTFGRRYGIGSIGLIGHSGRASSPEVVYGVTGPGGDMTERLARMTCTHDCPDGCKAGSSGGTRRPTENFRASPLR